MVYGLEEREQFYDEGTLTYILAESQCDDACVCGDNPFDPFSYADSSNDLPRGSGQDIGSDEPNPGPREQGSDD